MKALSNRMQQAWNVGHEIAIKYHCDLDTCNWNLAYCDVPEWMYLADDAHLLNAMICAGVDGREPEYVEAIRYGALPENGYSIDYSDNSAEKGVSCVKIIRKPEDEQYESIYDVTLGSFGGVTKYVVGGWYIGGVGSDGEPLLIECEVLREAK